MHLMKSFEGHCGQKLVRLYACSEQVFSLGKLFRLPSQQIDMSQLIQQQSEGNSSPSYIESAE